MSNLMEYKGYQGLAEFSAEDGLFVGTVLCVNDSLGFHGESVHELIEAFQNCIDDYLETCKALGRSPDKAYKGSFNIRIGPALHRQASIAAAAAGESLNQFVQEAIETKLLSPPPTSAKSIMREMSNLVSFDKYTVARSTESRLSVLKSSSMEPVKTLREG